MVASILARISGLTIEPFVYDLLALDGRGASLVTSLFTSVRILLSSAFMLLKKVLLFGSAEFLRLSTPTGYIVMFLMKGLYAKELAE